MNLASKTLYSDDPELVKKIRGANHPARFNNQWNEETDEDEEEEEKENEKSCHIEEAPEPKQPEKNKYTAAMDGAVMTDSEEEDEEDNSDDDYVGANYGTTLSSVANAKANAIVEVEEKGDLNEFKTDQTFIIIIYFFRGGIAYSGEGDTYTHIS
jgi:hypothetical protein